MKLNFRLQKYLIKMFESIWVKRPRNTRIPCFMSFLGIFFYISSRFVHHWKFYKKTVCLQWPLDNILLLVAVVNILVFLHANCTRKAKFIQKKILIILASLLLRCLEHNTYITKKSVSDRIYRTFVIIYECSFNLCNRKNAACWIMPKFIHILFKFLRKYQQLTQYWLILIRKVTSQKTTS